MDEPKVISETIEPTIEEKIEEAKPTKKGRKSRKDQLTEYIDGLEMSPETKEVLYKWVFQVGLPKGITVQQLQDKLRDLQQQCKSNESVLRESINKSYLNNWMGFFIANSAAYKAPQTSYKPQTADAELKQKPLVCDEVF